MSCFKKVNFKLKKVAILFFCKLVKRRYGCGLSATVILEKWFPLQGERGHSLNFFVCMYMLGFKNKIERRERRRQNNNTPINLQQGKNILRILHVHHAHPKLYHTQ